MSWIQSILLLACLQPAFADRGRNECQLLGDLVPPTYGDTATPLLFTARHGKVQHLELSASRFRSKEFPPQEVLLYRVFRPGSKDQLAELSFQFNSPTEGKFRGIFVSSELQGAGMAKILYDALANHPEFATIERVTSKYVEDNELGMLKALKTAGFFLPTDAQPADMLPAAKAINPETGKPYVAATNLWDKMGFTTSKVVWNRRTDQFDVEYERKIPTPDRNVERR